MAQRISAEILKDFFEAPIPHSTRYVNGKCRFREVCLKNLVSKVPAHGVLYTGMLMHVCISSVVRAVCQIFRLIAFRKGACTALAVHVGRAFDCTIAIKLVLASTIIKMIRCVLGAVFHPAIAANRW